MVWAQSITSSNSEEELQSPKQMRRIYIHTYIHTYLLSLYLHESEQRRDMRLHFPTGGVAIARRQQQPRLPIFSSLLRSISLKNSHNHSIVLVVFVQMIFFLCGWICIYTYENPHMHLYNPIYISNFIQPQIADSRHTRNADKIYPPTQTNSDNHNGKYLRWYICFVYIAKVGIWLFVFFLMVSSVALPIYSQNNTFSRCIWRVWRKFGSWLHFFKRIWKISLVWKTNLHKIYVITITNLVEK